MKDYSRLAMVGVTLSSILLSGDALLFYFSSTFLLADALLFFSLIMCLAYLFKNIGRNVKESNAFHVQLGNEIAGQLNSAHTELGNTQAILSDAIGKLVSNFILISDGVRDLASHTNDFSKQIHEVVDKVNQSLKVAESSVDALSSDNREAILSSSKHVRAIADELLAFNDAVGNNAVELNSISGNVEQNVLVVISTLQFQDMSSQLIEHAKLRMTALQEVASEMGKGAGSPDQQQYLEQIAAYNQLLDKHVVSLDKQKENPVKQKDFGTGDVELF
ncbi:MAG: hypothetical protein R8M11_03825 [Gallionella sp.]